MVLGWDSNDQLYDNTKFTGWHTAYPDAPVRDLAATPAAIFRSSRRPRCFSAEFAGRAEAVCPRGTLRRVLERAAAHGLSRSAPPRSSNSSCSMRRPQSMRDKGYRAAEDHDARRLRLLGAAQFRACGSLSRAARSRPDHALSDRGPAHRDRTRRARGGAAPTAMRSRPPIAPRSSRPSPRCSRSATA